VSPARRVLGYLRPYAARYGLGVGCLALATGFSLGIPWQVKEAVDGLRRGGGALAFHAGVIALLAALHFVDFPDKEINALGARGLGEIGLVGMAAAITDAVHHATGVRVRELPVKIEHLLG
jgi:hypothetical protein